MNIGIIGGGSIGLLFAFYLNSHHNVTIYTKSLHQKGLIEQKGLFLKKDEKEYVTKITAKHISEWNDEGNEDLTIICVKQHQLASLLELVLIPREHPTLFIQNGMGHLPLINKYQLKNVFLGTVEHGALRENEICVSHTGQGGTNIALFHGENDLIIREMIDPLEVTFPFFLNACYKTMLKKKLVVNAVINPLTAILKVPNGQLITNPYYFQLFTSLFNEIRGILALEDEQLYYENLIQVCRKTALNRSSMLKDIEENRETEIEGILGYLLEKASQEHIEAPLVKAFYQCIKGTEIEGRGKK